jgi:hypothetical protein
LEMGFPVGMKTSNPVFKEVRLCEYEVESCWMPNGSLESR